MPALYEVRNLVKQFPSLRAVDGISFEIQEGTCFGLLGPNGAGKTTTVEIMEGLTKPTSGDLLYRGEPPDKRFRNEAGIQLQSTVLQDFLTTREVLELFSSFYPRTLPLEQLVEMCALGEFLHRDNRKLSGGQRQRLFLALALVNDPDILFLDEPTTGLDPQARQSFWRLIQKIKKQNKTILLTTHYMEEASVVCDEILIMDHGRILARGEPEALLRHHLAGARLILPRDAFSGLDQFSFQPVLHGAAVEIETQDINATLSELMKSGVSLDRLRIKTPTLDDLFLDLTGREIRG